jgi:recombination protein RecA
LWIWNTPSTRSYAARCGVDVESLLISQPDTGEQALEITETLVRSGAVDVVVIDSVAALVPRAEIEGDMGDSPMGMQARLMSQALRKLSGAIKQTNTAVIFTNQLRQKIGVMFGNPRPPPAVWRSSSTPRCAWTCAASSPSSWARRSSATAPGCGWSRTRSLPPSARLNSTSCTTKASPRLGDLLDLATTLDIITKRGSFYSYGDIRLGQGRENSKDFLRQNPDLAEEIETIPTASF